MKKILSSICLIIILLLFLFIDIDVNAASLSIDENDYELVCIYDDGVQLTISRNDVYISNSSLSISSSSSSVGEFYLAPDQENDLYSENGSVYRHSNITENGRCPSKLYVYDLPSKYDENSSSNSDDVSTLYYSTKDGIEKNIAGTHGCGFLWLGRCSDATQMKDMTTNLVSEEVYLITTKNTTICDYVVPAAGTNDSQQAISIFMYDNLSIAEVNGRFTTLDSVWSECLQPRIYINDPTAKAVADRGSGVSYGNRYNYLRFYISTRSSNCLNYNDGYNCSTYTFLGERSDDGPGDDKEKTVCETLGAQTIQQIKRILNILQLLVPVLTIALSGFDIAKIVMSGNIDEELPKKKKVIIVRLIIMAFFFFLPLLTNLLIDGLQQAGVLGIEDIDCILE